MRAIEHNHLDIIQELLTSDRNFKEKYFINCNNIKKLTICGCKNEIF